MFSTKFLTIYRFLCLDLDSTYCYSYGWKFVLIVFVKMCLYLWAWCFANTIWLLKMFNLMLKSQHVLIPKWLNGVIYNDSQNRIWPFEEYQQQSSWARIVIWLRLWNSCEKDRSGWILLNKAACQNLLCSSCRTAVWPPVSL